MNIIFFFILYAAVMIILCYAIKINSNFNKISKGLKNIRNIIVDISKDLKSIGSDLK